VVLIADSGSTKCSWKLLSEDSTIASLYTEGINPFFRTTTSIYDELLKELLPITTSGVTEIFFYGSGIINEEKANIIRLALAKLYPGASIALFSDVVGASRSLFGTSKGIACILGTGSNVCLYNGDKVVTSISPLGFILGDEGSGAVLGRKLLGDYFKEAMPEPLREKFAKKFAITRDVALQRVYKTEKPNHFLASFAPFLSEEIASEYAHNLISLSFNEFFERNVTKIPDYSSLPIGFVGSIAFYFSNILKEVCEQYRMNCISILREPMDGLVKYHLNKNI
jgi:N-acetylglucosamine kinase-like BadF-type ATPase